MAKKTDSVKHENEETNAPAKKAKKPSTIAVLVPSFSAPGFLPACLESVVSLEVPPGLELEVIVICDGDGETFRECANHSVKAKLLRRRHGPGVAVNVGLESVSDAQFVAIVCADDIVAPDHLKKAVKAIGDAGNPAVYRPRVCSIKIDGKSASKKEGEGSHLACVWSASALDVIGSFLPFFRHAGDEALARAARGGVEVIDGESVTYSRRVHPAQLSASARSSQDDFEQSLIDSGEGPVKIPPVVAEVVATM